MKRFAVLMMSVPMLIAPSWLSSHDYHTDHNWQLEIEGVTQGAVGSGPDGPDVEVELDDPAGSDIARIRLRGTPAVVVRGNPNAYDACHDTCDVEIVSYSNSDDVTYVFTLNVVDGHDVPGGKRLEFDAASTMKFVGDEATYVETIIEP